MNEIELKKHVLDMLRDFMLGEEGQKFTPKPKESHPEPDGDEKEGLDEVLSKASEDYEEGPECDEEDEDEPKGLRAFLDRK